MGDLTKNFSRIDFMCHCEACRASLEERPIVKDEVVDAIQSMRDILGEPLYVTRGLSCAAHNAALGGADDSRHLPEHADALDIRSAGSQQAYRIVAAAILDRRFTFIEVAPGHIHLDMRPGEKRLITGKDH